MDQFEPFDTAYQHDSGEMWVPSSDGSGNLIPTGYFFHITTQMLPTGKNSGSFAARFDGPKEAVRISPWAYATPATALTVKGMLQPGVPSNVALAIVPSSVNTQFPVSVPQLQIEAKRANRSARINAGLLASNIARTTAFVDGKVKQFPFPCLEAALAELMAELDHTEE